MRYLAVSLLTVLPILACADADAPAAPETIPPVADVAPSLSIVAILYEDDLGTLASGGNSRATDINASRQITGWSGPPGQTRAFRWTPPGPMVDLGGFDGSSNGNGINDDGQVVGDASGLGSDAFLWTAPGPMEALAALSGIDQWAIEINNAGVIVGAAENPAAQPTVWYSPDDPVDIDPDQFAYGWAFGVNEANRVVGYRSVDNLDRAFTWTEDDGLANLGLLAAGEESQALDVNESDQMVGWAGNAAGNRRPVYWAGPVFAPQDLGTFGGDEGEARAINDAGTIAGFARTAGDVPRAFRRTTNGSMVALAPLGGDSSWGFGIGPTGHVVGAAELANGDVHAMAWWYYTYANTESCGCNFPEFPDPFKPGFADVTVLGSGKFAVRTLDPVTLTLGDGEYPDVPVLFRSGRPVVRFSDSNRDGFTDLIARFDSRVLVQRRELKPRTRELLFAGILLDRSNAVTGIWSAEK